ncbi:hypothetical protein [Fontivita pretiosa]|uniref:dockerin type I repeat-containing protein n=1 Tax=Fontivita pretiosa TaxID=2989684 RepID=UPI003D169827
MRRYLKALGAVALSSFGASIHQALGAFPPPVTANPAAEYTAAVGVDYNNVQTFSRILSFSLNDPGDYPRLYWFKYTSDGQSMVKFDTLGSSISTGSGGPVLGSTNETQIAVYRADGTKVAISRQTVDLNGLPIAQYPTYTNDPTKWYYAQGLSELYFIPDAPTNPRWNADPNDPNPYSGWAAPGNEGNAQKYYPPYYPTWLNEYDVWETALSPIMLDHDNNPVINPSTGQPRNQPGWRYYDRARVGPGATWNRYDALPAGEYYIAVSSATPTFAGDTYVEEVLRAPIHYDVDSGTFTSVLSGPLGTWQYYQPTPNSFNDYFGTIVLNVTHAALPVSAQWAVNSGGDWTVTAPQNWFGGVPTGANSVANFGTFGGLITAPQVVTVVAPITVGVINFDHPTASYTIAGSSTITLDASFYGQAALNVLAGSHTIQNPIVLNNNLNVNVSTAGSALTLTGQVLAEGRTIVKSGAGVVQFENVRAHALDITNGTVRISAKGTANSVGGTSVLTRLAIANIARLDLNNNSLIINSGSIASTTAKIKSALENGGAFDWGGKGIGSTQAAAQNAAAGSFLYGLGAILNDLAQVGGSGPIYSEFAGIGSLSSSAVLVKFTYFGDADLSGSIDATDYSLIDNGYVNSLSGWINGDFDYSGAIDATDYALIDNAYVNQSGALAEAMILEHTMRFGDEYLAALRAIQSGLLPEPAAAGLLACVAGLLKRPGRAARPRRNAVSSAAPRHDR